MTNNDKEERMLRVTESDVDAMKEELSAFDMSPLLKNQLYKIIKDEPGEVAYRNRDFTDLPLAPKHTDEEYEDLVWRCARAESKNVDLEARIKELEAFEPRCFGESYNFALSDCRKSVCPLAERCEKESE